MLKKTIEIKEKILGVNDELAQLNRSRFDTSGLFSMNIMASPGAGKTSLIEKTIQGVKKDRRLVVIDGDIATSLDAERAAALGATAIQVNTGGECHLDAFMLQSALNELVLNQYDLLIVENVGNLVCPSSFQLGTHKNVLVASIPEGDDKPYKYPGMYSGADVVIINKIDLLPYVPFRMEYFMEGINLLNPGVKIFTISCRTEEGLASWIEWVQEQIQAYSTPRETFQA
jgi:hydrogenase nickel incorporation protein HypB